MTREQRLELLKQIEKDIYVPIIESTFIDEAKSCAIHSIIKELEQEPSEDVVIDKNYWKGFNNGIRTEKFRESKRQDPCEDAISRQAALDCLTATKLKKFDFILHAREEIKKLPSVNPQPKIGHWILIDDFSMAKCSECGEIVGSSMISNYPYCHCGAKMESEVTE